MKPEDKPGTRVRQDRIILILVLLLVFNIGIRLILNPHQPIITVEKRAVKGIETRIDLNSASAEELAMLPGIGPVRARQITEYREKHGRFESVTDLLNIRGLGEKTINEIAGMLQVTE